MTRRLLLAVGTLAVLLAAFAVYVFLTNEPLEQTRAPDHGPVATAHGPAIAVREGYSVIPGKATVFMQYDSKGRLEAVYRAEKWDKTGDRFTLVDPRFEWHLRNGQTVYVSAREGVIRAKEGMERLNVRDGQLAGDVQVLLDRNVDIDRGPIDQRPGDVIRVQVDDLFFDNDLLTLRSDGFVSVFSREADILGRGLSLAWSEGPQELRELRIEHGEYMCVRQGQDRFLQDFSLPGASEPPTKTAPAGGAPAAGTGWPTLSRAGSDKEPGPKVETYQALLTGDVNVTSGARYLRGADELAIVFEFDSSRYAQGRAEPGSESRPAPNRPAPAELPPAIKAPRAAEQVPTTGPTTAPAAEPMIVTWTGPLVLKAAPGGDKPGPRRFDIAARGPKVELADGKTQAECTSLAFFSGKQTGELVGTKDRPVRLGLPTGERLTAERIDFNSADGTVDIAGAGTMIAPAGARAEMAGMGEGGGAAGAMEIAWTQRVDIRFAVEKTGLPGQRPRQYLTQAVFVGDVDVRQDDGRRVQAKELTVGFRPPAGPDKPVNRVDDLLAVYAVHLSDAAGGDFIKAECLHVPMAVGPDGRLRPSLAEAQGTVSARQRETEIESEKLTVTFGLETDPKTRQLRLQPNRLDAFGGVKITDRGGKEPVVAEADTLTTDMAGRTATLVGSPAKVTQENNVIEGPEIFMDESKGNANIIGGGKLRFWTKTDISGNQTDQARPVDIAWTRGLDYRGDRRIVVVDGEVKLDTAGDTLECLKMRVLLAPPKEETATRPTAPGRQGRLASDQFRSQKIAMVVAEKNVRLASIREDAEGFLEQRLQLKGDQVIYDGEVGKITAVGPGTLVVEDYREPEKPDAKKPKPARPESEIIPTSVSRPSQSVFQWTESMQMNQDERVAKLAGEVLLTYRSGRQIVKAAELKLHPRGELPEGRKTIITCGELLAQFDKPDATAATGTRPSDPLAGPRVGDLALFDARRDVNFVDGPRQALCQRIVYEKSKDIAVIYGNLEGQKPKKAVLYYRDEQSGSLKDWKSPRIVWYRKTNRVEAEKVEIGGGN